MKNIILIFFIKYVFAKEAFIQWGPNKKCLQPQGEYNGASIKLDNCNSQFNFNPDSITSIKYLNNQQLCIDVSGGNDANGTPLKLWTCLDNHPNQLFKFVNNNIIWNKNSNKCLDNLGGSNNIVLWDCVHNENQKFFYDNSNTDSSTCSSVENPNPIVITDSSFSWKPSNNYVGQNWCRGIIPISGWNLKKILKILMLIY